MNKKVIAVVIFVLILVLLVLELKAQVSTPVELINKTKLEKLVSRH